MGTTGIFKMMVLDDLNENTSLFRFMDLKQFLALIEKKKTYLTRIIEWEDPWEAPLRNLPTSREGSLEHSLYSSDEDIYGQCWTRVETDAMWRIYSPNKDGIMIETKVKKINNLNNLPRSCLAPIQYFDKLKNGIEELQQKKYPQLYHSVFLKRRAFEHENEVRLVANYQHENIERKHSPKIIEIPIDPIEFIISVTVDPRADEWYVETVRLYCKRFGFKFIVHKSDLYENNVFEKEKIVRIYTLVDE